MLNEKIWRVMKQTVGKRKGDDAEQDISYINIWIVIWMHRS